VARNRQRAKQRQAERRAARRALGGDSSARPQDLPLVPDAPPKELGQSDYTLAHTTEAEEFIGDLEIGDEQDERLEALDDETFELEDQPDEATDVVTGPRGVRGGREREEVHEHHERGRVMGFLAAVVAELKRVQWPDRAQLTSLTGITLLFVLIVGAYLGLLDAIFSKLINAIL
jgi:preprotein translocase subunit SecE